MFHDAYSRLDDEARRILHVLAVCERPIAPRAVSYILRPFLPHLDSTRAEERLDAMLREYPDLVHFEMGHYYVQSSDGVHLRETIERGEPSDREEMGDPLYTRFTLLHRAADYYKSRRKPQRNWQNLEDLSPQIHEFELRVFGEDYETAAKLLHEISFNYLLRWGHHRLVVELRERLVDKIEDPQLAQGNLGELGSAYAYLGDMEKAIACQEKALVIARRTRDRVNEGVWLTNLGNRYVNLGQTLRAVPYYEQALLIARERNDRRAEALNTASLGTCYAYLGEFERALECYNTGQAIARELDDLSMEGFCLSNLGNIYTALGQITRAISSHDQALEIARQMGSRVEEARRLGMLSDALIAGGHFREAIENLRLGLEIDDETGAVRGKNYKGASLARAYLFLSDLDSARQAVEMARRYDTPQNNYNVLATLGVIALRQGDLDVARDAFTEAIDEARQQIDHNSHNYDALMAQGLAFAGLMIAGGGARRANEEAAITAYKQAWESSKHSVGLALLAEMMLDALSKADPSQQLTSVLSAVRGA